jgi:hypothetical protein
MYPLAAAMNKKVPSRTAEIRRYVTMKSLIQAVFVAAVLTAPVASFAQSNQLTSRTQVRTESVQLEKAGYNSHGKALY